MTTFDKREEGFEKKFALDEEQKFKAMARRNKLLGIWAAEKLGLSGPEAEAYAKEVVMADFEEAGDDDVLRKIRKASVLQHWEGKCKVEDMGCTDRNELRLVSVVADSNLKSWLEDNPDMRAFIAGSSLIDFSVRK